MHVQKGHKGRRMRVALMPVLLAATLVLVAAGRGGIGNKPDSAARGAQPTAGGGFGEVYKAKTATLKKTLFNAKLLPSNKMARNIALAAYGRSDKKVNQNLALKCWKNNGCSTGTGGKLTVAYVEGFGENVYRAISQHVNLIVTYPDFGDAMLPVFREATKAGIPVATYAWGYVTGPGSNYLTVVGEDTCRLGKAYARVMNRDVKSGDIAFLGGFPGNPLSLGWQKCERPALNKNIHVVATEATNWDPSKVQEVVAGILSRYPNIKGWSYEYGLGMAQGAFAAYKAAGKPFNAVLTLRTDDVGMGCAAQKLHNPKLKVYYYTAGNSQIRVALTAAMMKLKGAKIPPQIVFPIELQNQAKRDSCVKDYPQQGSATSLVPLKLLKRMYP